MIYQVSYSHIRYEASSASPFSRRVVTQLSHLEMDEPTTVTLISGRQILVVGLDWSDDNWPVQLLVENTGILHRLDTVQKL